MPVGKSPVDVFRELLVQTPGERAEFLAKRTPESRKLIQAKLHEYESLTPEERELRLQVTELRWYLLPLMKVPAAKRSEQLALIPAGPRKLVEPRLDLWDKLPPEAQNQVLEDPDLTRYYIECAARNSSRATVVVAPAEEQRPTIDYNLAPFFSLTAKERAEILHTLSEPEREQIAKSLQTFANLSPAQRAECLRSFEKFASLPNQERQQFLKSAEQWNKMSPSERQHWKELVYKLSRLPPIPPGLGFPPLPGPLQPAGANLPGSLPPIVTNGHN